MNIEGNVGYSDTVSKSVVFVSVKGREMVVAYV